MKKVTLELENYHMPSNNEIIRMNGWVKKRHIENLKKLILVNIGEGPWKKVTFQKGEFPSHFRERVAKELKEHWPKKRLVYADIVLRLPRRYDHDNAHGGQKLIMDALVRMGWMVDDHVKWFHYRQQPQVIGDPKLIIELSIPETDDDEKKLKAIQGAA